QHKTKLTVGTKSLNVAKVNIIEPGWPCKGHGDEEVNFGEWLDYELIYLYVMFLPESGALCGLICWCIALEDALSEMLDDKVPAQKFLFSHSQIYPC
ncbi:hypothetical protein PVAP13_1NG158638, partial [Panicum virgatum]